VNLLLLAGGWTAFALLGRSWWQMLIAVFLGIMFTQTGFIGHDAGHRQISGSRRIDSLIGRIHGSLLIGLSYGWWISKHNRHHAHPNHPGRDPDIAGRAIALTADQSRARRGAGIWLARRQAWLFFPMLLLEGLNLHVPGVRAMTRHRATPVTVGEAGLLAAHIAGYLAAVFLVLSPPAGGRVHRPASGTVRPLSGIFVRPQPHGHARVRRGRQRRFPAPPGPDLTQRPR
jgi:fatty acid desaturase